MKKSEQKWDSTSPEERICDERLKYLAEWILESAWKELPLHVQKKHLVDTEG